MYSIGIDARTYFFQSGLGRYCRNLISSLLKLKQNERFVIWLSNHKSVSDFPVKPSDSLDIRISQASFGHWREESEILSEEVNSSGVDVFFSPYSPVPPYVEAPSVLTIHDLTALKFPEYHIPETVRYLKESLSESLPNVSLGIANSIQTSLDVQEFFPFFGDRTWIVPLGVEDAFFTPPNRDEFVGALSRYGICDKSYILYVGNIEPRKNLMDVLEAYAQSNLCHRIPFVLAGKARWGSAEVLARARREDLQSSVRILDFVPDEILPALYRGALFFVYLSAYEGFGLPVLEAMACETPVLTSKSSSLPEVAGDAAFLVDPRKLVEISAAMECLAGDCILRQKLAAAGTKRARQLSWQQTARRTQQLITWTALSSDSCSAERNAQETKTAWGEP